MSMTEKINLCKEVLENAIGVYKNCAECFDEGLSPLEAVSVQAMEELLEYQAIGTIDEFKALKEKSVAKKAVFDNEDGWETYICPNCGKTVGEHQKYCWNCGQALET